MARKRKLEKLADKANALTTEMEESLLDLPAAVALRAIMPLLLRLHQLRPYTNPKTLMLINAWDPKLKRFDEERFDAELVLDGEEEGLPWEMDPDNPDFWTREPWRG